MKMKKQFLLIVIVFLLIFVASCKEHDHEYIKGVCNCGDKDPNYVIPHVHEFVDGSCSCGESDPNYVVPHVHEFVDGSCSCGESDPDYVVPHVHTEVILPTTEATCTKTGLTEGKICSECGEILVSQKEIPTKDHEYNDGNCKLCGKVDPNHLHQYINGYCVCGEQHPNFGNCALDRNNELCLDLATWNWDYNKTNWDGKGMVIEIMAYPASEIDPFSNYYKGERKLEKQALIAKIESEYNIDIVYKDYPYDAPWGPERIKWISNGVTNNFDVGDIFLIDSSWIYQLQEKEAIAELYDLENETGIFAEYNYIQNNNYNSMASINNKVYAYAAKDLIPDYWLHYNQSLIEQYNLPDPATLWNNNEWTWSTFLNLLAKAQTAFDNDSNGIKRWAFGGDYFTNANGFVAARGGQFIKDGVVLLDDDVVVGVYEDLQNIEDLYWEPNGSTVSTTNFRDGLVLFQTGSMWFYGAAERWPVSLDFGISAVPYPRSDDDPNLEKYQIPITYQEMYAVRNVKDDETGLTSSILFNILDDLTNGLKPEATAIPSFEPAQSIKEYSLYLEARIENKDSIKAIKDIVLNHQDLVYFEMITYISMLRGQGSYYDESGIYSQSLAIITNKKIKPKERLGQLKPIYQYILDEVLGASV